MDKRFEFMRAKATRAYELARIKRSLWVFIPAIIFAVLGTLLCSTPAVPACSACLIGLFAVFFLWKG